MNIKSFALAAAAIAGVLATSTIAGLAPAGASILPKELKLPKCPAGGMTIRHCTTKPDRNAPLHLPRKTLKS